MENKVVLHEGWRGICVHYLELSVPHILILALLAVLIWIFKNAWTASEVWLPVVVYVHREYLLAEALKRNKVLKKPFPEILIGIIDEMVTWYVYLLVAIMGVVAIILFLFSEKS
jgi:hypothetical protein